MRNARTADGFFRNATEWKAELKVLREIVLSAGLEETVKWGGPVYTLGGKNVVGIGGFKSYFGLWFFQGALLADKAKKLINAQEGVTVAQRQWRFRSAAEIDRRLILKYLDEAIGNTKAGREIKPSRKPLVIPPELEAAFEGNGKLRDTFDKFGLSKKREFVEYVESAKRADTRSRRLEKIVPLILRGRGLNDTYR